MQERDLCLTHLEPFVYRIEAYLVFKGHLQYRCGFSGNSICLHIPSVDRFIVLGPLKKASTGGCDLVKRSLVEKKLVLPLRWGLCRRREGVASANAAIFQIQFAPTLQTFTKRVFAHSDFLRTLRPRQVRYFYNHRTRFRQSWVHSAGFLTFGRV